MTRWLTALLAILALHTPAPADETLAPADRRFYAIALDGRSLQVSVRDYGAPFRPRAVPVALDARRGRGLLVVAGICSAWGILVHGDGKTVWATVAPDEGQGASSTQS